MKAILQAPGRRAATACSLAAHSGQALWSSVWQERQSTAARRGAAIPHRSVGTRSASGRHQAMGDAGWRLPAAQAAGAAAAGERTHLPSFFSWAMVPLTLLLVTAAAMAATRTAPAGRAGRGWALEGRAACCRSAGRAGAAQLRCCDCRTALNWPLTAQGAAAATALMLGGLGRLQAGLAQ